MNNSENLMLEVTNTIATIEDLYKTIKDREDKIADIFKQYISDFQDKDTNLRLMYTQNIFGENRIIVLDLNIEAGIVQYTLKLDSFMEYAKTADKAIPFKDFIKIVKPEAKEEL